MKVDIKSSSGVVLDFVAAKAFGYRVGLTSVRGVTVPCHWVQNEWDGDEDFSLPKMSTDGREMVKVLAKERYTLSPAADSDTAWECSTGSGIVSQGDTAQVALARCLALDKLGAEIEIPDEVLNPLPF